MSVIEATNIEVTVENLGGIDSTTVQFQPGITILAGRNATNRTSLLRAITGALGGNDVFLKADKSEGMVELEMDGETYHRRFERRNGTVVTEGEPYLTDADDVEIAELFAFLLESNEARRAVTRQADLRDLMMRPVDTVEIQQDIDELVRRRERVDDELTSLEDLAEKLPGLETRRQELETRRAELTDELEEKREELEAADESVEAKREEQSALDERMDELQSVRDEITATRQRLRTERRSVESLEEELEELETTLSELPAAPEADVDIDARLGELRSQQDHLETKLNELQSIVQFNEKMLDGTSSTVATLLRGEDSSPTEELLPDEDREVVCWTCGSAVERAQLEETVETLREVRQEKLEERATVRERIDELQTIRRERRSHEQERRDLERRIEDTTDEITDREERIEELETERADLEERVEELEAAVRDLQSEEQDELLDLNREVNELEFDRDQVQTDLEEVEAEIDRIESRLEDREGLEADREELSERIEDLRTRIERTETEAVEQFNEHMQEVLTILDYENLDRVWIERKQLNGETRFDLHVIRSTAEGSAYEDRIEHLSESEREVVGLVFALAGYLVHDIYDTVPFLLLDSLEALDSERIAALVDYFGEYSESLVVALLPRTPRPSTRTTGASAKSERSQRTCPISLPRRVSRLSTGSRAAANYQNYIIQNIVMCESSHRIYPSGHRRRYQGTIQINPNYITFVEQFLENLRIRIVY